MRPSTPSPARATRLIRLPPTRAHPFITTTPLLTHLRTASPMSLPLRQSLLRSYSSQSPSPLPPAHTTFWKTFSRPLIKTLLIAILTYQLLYLGWASLSFEEHKVDTQVEIKALEAELDSIQKQYEEGEKTKGK